jgi:hypothetical protein
VDRPGRVLAIDVGFRNASNTVLHLEDPDESAKTLPIFIQTSAGKRFTCAMAFVVACA